MNSLTERINVGTKRETFFLNQLRSAGHKVLYPNKGDFFVDGKYLFEVGGKDKSFEKEIFIKKFYPFFLKLHLNRYKTKSL